jgi:hypothetical protein
LVQKAGEDIDQAALFQSRAEDKERRDGQGCGAGKDAQQLVQVGEGLHEGKGPDKEQDPEHEDSRQVRGDTLKDEAGKGRNDQEADKNYFPQDHIRGSSVVGRKSTFGRQSSGQ